LNQYGFDIYGYIFPIEFFCNQTFVVKIEDLCIKNSSLQYCNNKLEVLVFSSFLRNKRVLHCTSKILLSPSMKD